MTATICQTPAREWNEARAVGAPVLALVQGPDRAPVTARTRSRAWESPQGHGVVALYGYSGGIPLDLVTPIEIPGHIHVTEPRTRSCARWHCTRCDRTEVLWPDEEVLDAWAEAAREAARHACVRGAGRR
ncbi:hypothetical protein [Nocardiopsis halophila]|uniref:hypothetical protein n=1 Tax=Nocardiopsis halophila TaxID=141692 RepID=UPI00034B01B9|nr:hypothetical protein [Nocardiopsis halophila]